MAVSGRDVTLYPWAHGSEVRRMYDSGVTSWRATTSGAHDWITFPIAFILVPISKSSNHTFHVSRVKSAGEGVGGAAVAVAVAVVVEGGGLTGFPKRSSWILRGRGDVVAGPVAGAVDEDEDDEDEVEVEVGEVCDKEVCEGKWER